MPADAAESFFGVMSVDHFLSEYWQKKPLFIKGALPDFKSPITPDELAGLAVEPDVESRVVLENGPEQWELRHGPFEDDTFHALPRERWTLLVQGVDTWVPEVAALVDHFRFIPNWRIDDVMISYAADKGGVGPHYDTYDVFLLQGLGRRRWEIGDMCDDATPRLEHPSLRILREFTARDGWDCEPGDLLYLPPRLAHLGVALGNDCMTYSVGFRAPGVADMIRRFRRHSGGPSLRRCALRRPRSRPSDQSRRNIRRNRGAGAPPNHGAPGRPRQPGGLVRTTCD